MRLKIALSFLLAIPSFILMGQNQLILFNREKVIARFSYGDNFTYKLKKSKHYTSSFITDLKEFSVITFNDTVLFSEIDRVSLKGIPKNRLSRPHAVVLFSKLFIIAGLSYFVIDQFNNIVVRGSKPDLDPAIWKPSLVLVTVGYGLTLTYKRSQRIRYPAKLAVAPEGSRFYK